MRIALAQLNPIVGDVAGNLTTILDAMEQARRQGASLVVTSELAIIGYPPKDLLLRGDVVEACEAAVQAIANAAGELWVVVGYPRRVEGGTRPLRNSVAVCHAGRVVAVGDKQLLPGYDVFDEDRYFDPGQQSLVCEIAGVRFGVVVCEDLWRAHDVTAERRYPVEPITELASSNVDCVLSLNASPFVIGKWQRHLQMLSRIARDIRRPIVAVNQVGANDDLIFDGRSVVVETDGRIRHVLDGFASEIRTVELTLDQDHEANDDSAAAEVERWSDSSREIFHALALGLRDYAHKTRNHTMILGLSGGIDSALVATLATAAMGPAHVVGVMMPSVYSSEGSINDSEELAKRLQIVPPIRIPLASLHENIRSAMQQSGRTSVEGVTDENIQARLRGLILMAVSNAIGGIVVATSNKSEMAVGYCTLYGDMCGAVAPLADLTKSRVYALSRWINEHFSELGFAAPPIPENSISKPPSAELRPNQTDQDTLPAYNVLDAIIERRIELEQSAKQIIDQTGFDPEEVDRTIRMIDRAQFKRDQAGVVLKVTGRAFGFGRPMPIAMDECLTVNATNVRTERSSVGIESATAHGTAQRNTDEARTKVHATTVTPTLPLG